MTEKMINTGRFLLEGIRHGKWSNLFNITYLKLID